MKNRLLFLQILALASCGPFSKGAGIGTTTHPASSAPEITARGEGLLKPRMSTTSINAITKSARGLMVFDPLPFRLTSVFKTNCSKILN